MSRRTRDFLLTIFVTVLVLAALHALDVGSKPPQAAQATRPEPFPERVVAQGAPLPQYASGPYERVQQRVAALDAMWAEVFRAAGERYERPLLVISGGDVKGCGAVPSGGWAGLYCPNSRTLVIDLDGHAKRHQMLGQGMSDLFLGYIVAHELGHHVQTLRGAPDRHVPSDQRIELHAMCLAGVWGHAAGVALPPAWIYSPSPRHGSVESQIRWLNEGHRFGRPGDCDAVWEVGTVL